MASSKSFRIAVEPGPEAEGFNDAFYRFLELHCRDLEQFEERAGTLQTTPLGDREEKLVSLWSDAALEQFVRFWRARNAGRRALRAALSRPAVDSRRWGEAVAG